MRGHVVVVNIVVLVIVAVVLVDNGHVLGISDRDYIQISSLVFNPQTSSDK